MNDAKEELGKKLVHFFQDIGWNPLYAITGICIIVSLSYYKDFKKRDELPRWHLGLMYSAFFGTVVLSFFSFLQLIGVLKL